MQSEIARLFVADKVLAGLRVRQRIGDIAQLAFRYSGHGQNEVRCGVDIKLELVTAKTQSLLRSRCYKNILHGLARYIFVAPSVRR